jgi:hypothetical protein
MILLEKKRKAHEVAVQDMSNGAACFYRRVETLVVSQLTWCVLYFL